MLRVEDADEAGATVSATGAVTPGLEIRRAGEDIAAGEVVLGAGPGSALRSSESPPRRAPPSCPVPAGPALQSSSPGDELVEPGAPLPPEQIRNTNGYAIPAQARAPGRTTLAVDTRRRRLRGHGRGAAAGAGGRRGGATGGVSVGAARPRQAGARRARSGAGLLGRRAATRASDLVRDARRPGTRASVFRATRSPRWSPSTCSCGRRLPAMLGDRAGERRATAVIDADYPKRPGQGARGALHARGARATDGTCDRPRSRGPTCSRSMLDAEALAYLEVERGDVSAGEAVEIEIL